MSIITTLAVNLFLAVAAPIGGDQPPSPPPVQQEQPPLQGPMQDGRTLDQKGTRK